MRFFKSSRGVSFCSATITIATSLLVLFQNCQKPHFSDSLSETVAVGSSGGDGTPYEGIVAHYIYADPSNPCSQVDSNGNPLPNAEIIVTGVPGQDPQLVRTDCTDLQPPLALNPAQVQLSTDGSGDVSYNGALFTPRVNLLLSSQDFTNSNWQKVDATVAVSPTVTSPIGTTDVVFMTEDTSYNSWHYLSQEPAYNYLPGSTMTFSVYAKAGTRRYIHIQIQDGIVFQDQMEMWFDLQTGSITRSLNVNQAQPGVGQVTPLSNGWYRIAISGVPTPRYNKIDVDISPESTDTMTTYTGDGTSGLYLWGAQLEQGAAATAYSPSSVSGQ